MNQQLRIRKIMSSTNCTYDKAVEADNQCNGNVEQAIEMANSKSNELYVGGTSSGQMVDAGPKKHVIKGYKNGILVNNKFYDYTDTKNIKLKEMLDNNEFDAEVLGVNDTQAEVVYKNHENEFYGEKTEEVEKSYENFQRHVLSIGENLNVECPDEIILDQTGDIKFKFMADDRRVTVLMNSKMIVNDFYNAMRKYIDVEVCLMKDDVKVDGIFSATVLKQKMFKLVKK